MNRKKGKSGEILAADPGEGPSPFMGQTLLLSGHSQVQDDVCMS